jgi:acyl-[acyl-carrier-protein]-phospholipid O-acyltransferase/long-chain-fatty-acid--[acyl-carrier-protein] ligase
VQESKKSTFLWLNATQALGVINDNLYKLMVIAYLIGVEGEMSEGKITATAGAIFTLPFLLFTAYAGKLADRFSKRRITVILKCVEIGIMSCGVLSFYFRSDFMLYTVMFLMTTHSAIFSPSKYGLIPELVDKENLVYANGILETTTYLAAISAAVIVPLLVLLARNNYTLASSACIIIAMTGTAASLRIKKTPAMGVKGSSSLLFFKDIAHTLYDIRHERSLVPAIFASAYFMLIGTSATLVLIPYGMQNLSLSQTNSMYLFVPGALGIAAGAFYSGRVCGKGVEVGLVGLGAISATILTAALGLIKNNLVAGFAIVFFLGASAGTIIIPLNSYIQLHSPVEKRGRVIAAANFLGWTGSFLAAVFVYILSEEFQLSGAHSFLVLSVMTAVLACASIIVMPELLLRVVLVGLIKFLYRIKVVDLRNVPSEGGLLFVSNHCSWTDAVVLMAAQNRHIRFIMDKEFYNIRFLNPFCKIMDCIPISEKDASKKIYNSLATAKDAVENGQAVCIFAEGAMTHTGELQPFKRGLHLITEETSCSIVPVYIGGTWGSIFSYSQGRPFRKFPRKFFRKVYVYFGEPLGPSASVEEIQKRVEELSIKYKEMKK